MARAFRATPENLRVKRAADASLARECLSRMLVLMSILLGIETLQIENLAQSDPPSLFVTHQTSLLLIIHAQLKETLQFFTLMAR